MGGGTILAYGRIGVVIHKDALSKKNCVIESNAVTGDNVFVGTGARFLGDEYYWRICSSPS